MISKNNSWKIDISEKSFFFYIRHSNSWYQKDFLTSGNHFFKSRIKIDLLTFRIRVLDIRKWFFVIKRSLKSSFSYIKKKTYIKLRSPQRGSVILAHQSQGVIVSFCLSTLATLWDFFFGVNFCDNFSHSLFIFFETVLAISTKASTYISHP